MIAKYFILVNSSQVFYVGAEAWISPVKSVQWLWQVDDLSVRG